MSRENLKDICTKYFETWGRKDIDGLAALFANDIRLQDWERIEDGIYRVLNANQQIFDSFISINVEVIGLYQDPAIPNKVVCQLYIEFKLADGNSTLHVGDSTLHVTDIITFNDEDKISMIWAYKG